MVKVLVNILEESWSVLGDMAPFLLFGFLVAGILSVIIRPELIERHLSGKGIGPILKATLFGIPLPLCSCGVIPVAASLRRHGASKGATSAFLLSTPQTGVDSILVTYSLLGGVFAIFRPIAALFSGLFGGALVDMFSGAESDYKRVSNGNAGSALNGEDVISVGHPVKVEDDWSDGKNGNEADNRNVREGERNKGLVKGRASISCKLSGGNDVSGSKSNEGRESILAKIYRMFKYSFVTLPSDISGALLIGLLVAGVISAVVPDDYFAGLLGGGLTAMFVMMLLGLPVYVCATASVPVAAVLIGKGVSPGAAFAFLMTGPATNAATVAVIYKMLGKGTTIIYLLTVAVLAMAGGMMLDYIFQVTHTLPGSVSIWMPGEIIKSVSAVILLGVLLFAYVANKRKSDKLHLDGGDKVIKLKVGGMTCNHCAESVRKGLLELDRVKGVKVDLQSSQVELSVEGDSDIAEDLLRAKIEGLGYEFVGVSSEG